MKTHLGDGVKVIYRYNLNEYLLSVSNIFSKSTTVVYKHFFLLLVSPKRSKHFTMQRNSANESQIHCW